MSTLEPFGADIWIAAGPIVTSAGFRYPTRMALIRLADGGLFVWSPVSLPSALRASVDALGEVRFIAAPNALHHLSLVEWKNAYPRAMFYAPPGLRARRNDIAFGGDLGDAPPPDWAGQIDQVVVRGNLITTEIVFFHRKSGVVLFTDLLQNFPADWFTGWRASIARMDRMIAHEPQVPQKFRSAFVNRKAARESLAKIMAWPAEKVLMAHGQPIQADGGAYLRRAFRWLR